MESSKTRIRFEDRPILVFWETTRACPLACRHCRAAATCQPAPDELSAAEGTRLVGQIAAFGSPAPVLILTGGDCLLRRDLFDLIEYADSLGVPVALAPAVSPLLSNEVIARIASGPVRAVSLSLDGIGTTHDRIRGIPGHHDQTIAAIKALAAAGVPVQVNTTVMRENVGELADVFDSVAAAGAGSWEVFFLVNVGRGTTTEAVTAYEHEQVCHFLCDAAGHGLAIRAVEAPFLRRVAAERAAGGVLPGDSLYRTLASRLRQLLGQGNGQPGIRSASTRDGKGIIFVAHDGTVYPAGFLPLPLGNVRAQALTEIYRDHPLLRSIRAARFTGRCGRCDHADLCGGSRSRAYASGGDPLGEDPACPYVPQ